MPTPHYSLLVALFTWLTLAHSAPSPKRPTPNTPAYTPSYVAHILVRLENIEGDLGWLGKPECLGRSAHVAGIGEPCGVFGITELPGTQQALTTPARVPIEVRNVSPGAQGNTYCGVNNKGTFTCSYPRGNSKIVLEPIKEEGVNLMAARGYGGYTIDIVDAWGIRWNPAGAFRAIIERTDEAWTEPEPEPEKSVFSKLKSGFSKLESGFSKLKFGEWGKSAKSG